MQTTTGQVLKILLVLSWLIFIGVAVEAGGLIFNAFYTLAINPHDAQHFWEGMDLSGLYKFGRGQFLLVTLAMSSVAIMRALVFYVIIKILDVKNLRMAQPFSNEVGRFIFKISYLALAIGIISVLAAKYTEWLINTGVTMPNVEYLRLGGADVWLFMGVTLYVVAQVFKRGIEIQTENELTV